MNKVADVLNVLTKHLDKSTTNYEDLLVLVSTLTNKLQEKYKRKQIEVSDLKQQLERLNNKYSISNTDYFRTITGNDLDTYEHPTEIANLMTNIETIVNECWTTEETKKVFAYGGDNYSKSKPSGKIVELNLKYKEDLTTQNGNSSTTVAKDREYLDNRYTAFNVSGLNTIQSIDYEDHVYDKRSISLAMKHPEYKTKRIFNNLVTDFCVKNFFLDKRSRLTYIDLIQKTFFKMIDEISKKDSSFQKDNNITLLLKGGIVIRLVLQDIFRDFYSEISDELSLDFRKELKLGDFDFEIITIKKELEKLGVSYETFKLRFDICSYAVICLLNKFLEEHKRHYFGFFVLDSQRQQEKIDDLISRMNDEIDSITGNLDFYKNYKVTKIQSRERSGFALFRNVGVYGGINVNVAVAKSEEGDSVFKTIKNNDFFREYNLTQAQNLSNINSAFYSTHNPVVSFGAGKNFCMFTLNRIKYNFEVTFTPKAGALPGLTEIKRNIVGEVLDLSHPFEADRRDYMEYALIPNNKYFRKIKFANSNYEFSTLSEIGLVVDLSDIVFEETDWNPWKDIKYSKRIRRVIALALILSTEEYSFNNKTFTERIEIFESLRNLVDNDFTSKPLVIDFDNLTIFTKLYNNLRRVSENSTDPKYPNYKQTVLKIFDFIINSLKIHWNKTRSAFLTDSRIDTGLLGIDFYNLY